MRGQNSIGFGEYSETSVVGSLVETEPTKVGGIYIDYAISTLNSLYLHWTHLESHEETGGSPVLNYKIRYDQGSVINTMVDVATIAASSNPQYHLEGLTAGVDYKVSIIAENIHGWS